MTSTERMSLIRDRIHRLQAARALTPHPTPSRRRIPLYLLPSFHSESFRPGLRMNDPIYLRNPRR